MPTIHSELRLWISGNQAPLLKKETLSVDSCEYFTLSASAHSKATYTFKFSNVKFAAIYSSGQGGQARVKIGNSKPASVVKPLIFLDRAASRFNGEISIVVENDTALPGKAVLVVGSDLPGKNKKEEKIVRTEKAKAARKPASKPRNAKRTSKNTRR